MNGLSKPVRNIIKFLRKRYLLVVVVTVWFLLIGIFLFTFPQIDSSIKGDFASIRDNNLSRQIAFVSINKLYYSPPSADIYVEVLARHSQDVYFHWVIADMPDGFNYVLRAFRYSQQEFGINLPQDNFENGWEFNVKLEENRILGDHFNSSYDSGAIYSGTLEQIRVAGNPLLYPFDSYKIAVKVDAQTNQTQSFETIDPFFYQAIPGFFISDVRHVSGMYFEITLKRPIYFIALIIAVLITIMLVFLAIIMNSSSNKRITSFVEYSVLIIATALSAREFLIPNEIPFPSLADQVIAMMFLAQLSFLVLVYKFKVPHSGDSQ